MTDGIQLGTSGPDMNFICVTYVEGASYDSETGMLTGYTESPITYEYVGVDGNGKLWPMVDVNLHFTLK